jgi:hypothetical protein
MAITNFIPELWAAALLEVWWNETVFAALVNREYEGIATRGNTVNITGVVVPTVSDYAAAGRTTSAEDISDTGIQLTIDQEKSTDFYVDDIDRAQAAGSLSAYADAAGVALVEDSDKFIADLLISGGTPVSLSPSTTASSTWGGNLPGSGDDCFNILKDLRKQLNKNAVPSANRVAVINAEFEGLLLTAASKLTTFYQVDDTEGLRNATLGQLLGMRIVISNNLSAFDTPQAVAFAPRAAAYVSQIDQVEAMRAQNKFADRIRALHVYGGKVVRPIGVAVFNQGGS